jgi:imidazolonepropionase-like amidohydrolase
LSDLVLVELRTAEPLTDVRFLFRPDLVPVFAIGFCIYFSALGSQVAVATLLELPGHLLGYGFSLTPWHFSLYFALVVAEADAAGLAVMAHAQATDGIKAAIRTGIRSIEHGIYLDEEAVEMMLEAGTWLMPTLSAPRAVLDAVDAGASLPPAVIAKAHEVIDAHQASFAMAAAAGVKIAMGTDSGVGPHGSNLTELALMARGGMTPSEVLVATTSAAAELMGLGDQLGRIAPGLRADLVVVNGDPYDLDQLRSNIRLVYQDGQLAASSPKEETAAD